MPPADESLNEFLIESHELLDGMEAGLLSLEKSPQDPEAIDRIFRAIHSIKGASGFLSLAKIEAVSHEGETLLARLRDQTIRADAKIVSALLDLSDCLRQILSAIERDGSEGGGDYSAAMAAVRAIYSSSSTDALVAQAGEAAGEAGGDSAAGSGASAATLRVDLLLLEKLMNLVGELVLARNQILQHAVRQRDSGFLATTQRLNLVTSELQEGMMKTRMQPISTIWGKFPRIVRDLGVQLGKKIRIEMEGKETEVDRTIIEAIKDPMSHMIRNACDHGVETTAERTAAGKPAEGRIVLRAWHEGGQVIIEMTDDGRGMDPAKLKAKAVAKGLITTQAAEKMDDAQALRLIFEAGFSTAEKVTSVSGRGVGMDVVKSNVERIGGSVDLHSVVGKMTTIRIKIPLTLAIIPALIIRSGGEIFAIPQVNLLELVRIDPEHSDEKIEEVNGEPVFRLRGKLLPIAFLNKELKLDTKRWSGQKANLVVLMAEEHQFGLVVDSIMDTEEIVVKPLGAQLKSLSVFAGASIMGDGRVALILDVVGLAKRARLIQSSRQRNLADASGDGEEKASGDLQTLLVFRAAGRERMALSMAKIDRLEEFQPKVIERSGQRPVVQYRGGIMPLISLAEYLGEKSQTAPSGNMQVIVFNRDGHRLGLIVDRILDIVEQRIEIEAGTVSKGTLGSAVVQGRITDLLDLDALLTESYGAKR